MVLDLPAGLGQALPERVQFGANRRVAALAAVVEREARRAALARFVESGLPTAKTEDWKYTSVDAIRRGSFRPAPAATCWRSRLS